LGTEFEYTRTVDEKGKVVDPFVPKFDIMKVKDLNKEVHKSQKVNVESPRFIGTLKRALTEMFKHADTAVSGELSYTEFANAFKTLSYGLTDNDIKTLIALADDNNDGKITWEEFIPVAIDAIKTFFARNKALQKVNQKEKEIRKEALQLVYQDEIGKCTNILTKKFKSFDEKNTGSISIKDLRRCMQTCALLTPKEVNVIMRSFKESETMFEYKNFHIMLFDVRFELARSRLMDTGLDKLSTVLLKEFAAFDKNQTGVITITEIKKALFNSKYTSLTPFQVFILIGMSNPDEKGHVKYEEFAGKCKVMIEELFTMKTITEKANLIETKQYKPHANLDQIEVTNFELFEFFKKYDRNENGFLEIHEYIQCLKDSKINLTEAEIITLGLSADVNGDERIDYEEFMKHF
jgi:Ca2+-binding EF-hand superfamily protein